MRLLGRLPATYEDLKNSVYMPSPEALINLYTNQPVRLVTEPSAGDFRWSYQTAEEPGKPAYHMVTLSFFYAPGGEGTELKVSEKFMAEGSGNYQSNWWNGVKGWVEGLTDREKRLFWLCGLLDIHLIEAGQFLGLRGRFFRRFQDYQIIDWWLPPSVLKNLWTGEPMRAVPFDQPSPGNFTYGHHLAEDGEPFVLSPRCYGENGRVIYTWYDKAKMEMDRVSREAGYDYTRYSDS